MRQVARARVIIPAAVLAAVLSLLIWTGEWPAERASPAAETPTIVVERDNALWRDAWAACISRTYRELRDVCDRCVENPPADVRDAFQTLCMDEADTTIAH